MAVEEDGNNRLDRKSDKRDNSVTGGRKNDLP